MSGHHFLCKKCKEWACNYNHQEKSFKCESCNHEEKVKPKKSRCFRCHTSFDEYTWFDPSSCPRCNRSFVD